MKINHLDLFSGIGGFAYAVDQVFPGANHTFCDNNKFCHDVIKKHWPESKIYADIRTIIADPEHNGGVTAQADRADNSTQPKSPTGSELFKSKLKRINNLRTSKTRWDILTGGFPCQPFSAAGKRKGTSDDRHLWPEMFRVIKLTKPQWIIGENVPGIINIEGGMVFEQVCTDLENEGYEVQPFIIPACSVNAPHKRDRVWIVANRQGGRKWGSQPEGNRPGKSQEKAGNENSYAQDPISLRSGWRLENSGQILGSQSTKIENEGPSWEKDWLEVATELCSLDDGLPVELGEFKLTQAGHRREQLKAYGNAIVPQVAIEIMRAIRCAMYSK